MLSQILQIDTILIILGYIVCIYFLYTQSKSIIYLEAIIESLISDLTKTSKKLEAMENRYFQLVQQKNNDKETDVGQSNRY